MKGYERVYTGEFYTRYSSLYIYVFVQMGREGPKSFKYFCTYYLNESFPKLTRK